MQAMFKSKINCENWSLFILLQNFFFGGSHCEHYCCKKKIGYNVKQKIFWIQTIDGITIFKGLDQPVEKIPWLQQWLWPRARDLDSKKQLWIESFFSALLSQTSRRALHIEVEYFPQITIKSIFLSQVSFYYFPRFTFICEQIFWQ